MLVYIDKDFLPVVPMYLDYIRRQMETLKRLLYIGDFDSMGIISMNMKVSGPNYGFHEIGELGRDLLMASGCENSLEIERLIENVEEYIKRVEVEYIEM